MIHTSSADFNQKLSEFIKDNSLEDSFQHWMGLDAGVTLLSNMIYDELDRGYTLTVETDEYLKEISRKLINISTHLSNANSASLNFYTQIKVKAYAKWLDTYTYNAIKKEKKYEF